MHTTTEHVTVHYQPAFAAQGGPTTETCPRIQGTLPLMDPDRASVAVIADGASWKIVDHDGRVFAETYDPADLAGWMATYLVELGRTVRGL